jgi:hypothetical protein
LHSSQEFSPAARFLEILSRACEAEVAEFAAEFLAVLVLLSKTDAAELLSASAAEFSPVFAAEFSSVAAFLRESFCFAILSFAMMSP